MIDFDYIEQCDCLELMKKLPDSCIDLTVTSPPYDNLRDYNGNIDGGVVVWIVNDATIKGSETGTSFKQALYFKECGFNIHDTMIWSKPGFTAVGTLKTRYASTFEYMFVFSKGKPKSFNPIKDRKNICGGTVMSGTIRQKDGSTKPISSNGKILAEYGIRYNVWDMPGAKNNKTGHPAVFPENLVKDHIITWSNKGEVVLDPFLGSGTTAIAAINTNRHYIGFELDPQYFQIACDRLDEAEEMMVTT